MSTENNGSGSSVFAKFRNDTTDHVIYYHHNPGTANEVDVAYYGPIAFFGRNPQEFQSLLSLLYDFHVINPMPNLKMVMVNALFHDTDADQRDVIAVDGGESLIRDQSDAGNLSAHSSSDADSAAPKAESDLTPYPGRIIVAIFRVFLDESLEEISALMRDVRDKQRDDIDEEFDEMTFGQQIEIMNGQQAKVLNTVEQTKDDNSQPEVDQQ